MRRHIIVLTVVSILLISVLVFSIVAAAAENPGFVGDWEAIDPVDSSDYTMQIRGGGRHCAVIIWDSACSGCGVSEPPCKAIGQGTISGVVLTAKLTVTVIGCPSSCQGNTANPEFTYNSSSDTLDGLGTTWYRV